MKHYSFLFFVAIILSIHILVNYYIFQRSMNALEATPALKPYIKYAIILCSIAYPLGRFLERIWYNPATNTLHWIGAFWFAAMLYFVLLLAIVDTSRLLNSVFHFLPEKGSLPYLQLKLKTFASVFTIGILIILGGFLNAWHPKIHKYTLHFNKSGGNYNELKIVAASDIHLGTIIGPRKTNKLVQTINNLKPDIILFAGDVVDEDVQPVINQNLGDSLRKLSAPLGVFSITGNHEYIGGADRSINYLEEHGIKILRDSAILINNSFYIVGREDKDKQRFTNQPRKEINQLIENTDSLKPIILLDHQPMKLELAEKAGIDLQISGHTHHGQLWPFGYITNKIFEVSRGYKQKGNSHFIVSTGFGTWGPPVRTGNRPEILEITIKFDK